MVKIFRILFFYGSRIEGLTLAVHATEPIGFYPDIALSLGTYYAIQFGKCFAVPNDWVTSILACSLCCFAVSDGLVVKSSVVIYSVMYSTNPEQFCC